MVYSLLSPKTTSVKQFTACITMDHPEMSLLFIILTKRSYLAKKLLGLFQRAFKKNSFLQQITLENLRHSLTQAHLDQDI